MIKEFCRTLFFLLYRITPKRNHAVIWGWPDGEDNSRALARVLVDYQVTRIIVLMTDASVSPLVFDSLDPRLRCITKGSLAALLWFLSARYVFFTHRCFMRRFPDNVVSVNVWHGMPIKRIGWMLEGDEGIDSRYILATSPFWSEIMRKAMCPHGEVLVTGLPRNDRLFSDPAVVRGKLGIRGSSGIRNLVVWLPTYRKSVRGDLRVDGNAEGGVFGPVHVNADALNDFLAAHSAMMLVKPHPMAAFEEAPDRSHLKTVDDEWLLARGLSLYELLGGCGLLISDISSVAVDFLLLDRPVIHCFPDLEEYRRSRGFTIDPVDDALAGPVVTTFAELLESMRVVLQGGDPERARRRAVRERFHQDKDAGATRRLLEAIGLERRSSHENKSHATGGGLSA
jgi:CDP-glycerol glycerophosphotransferase (TagB/SpsB family)